MDRELTLADRVRPQEGVHSREFNGELVLLDLKSGQYYGLDALGCRLYAGLAAGKSIGEIAGEMVGEFDASLSQIERDLLDLTVDLVDKGLLVRTS